MVEGRHAARVAEEDHRVRRIADLAQRLLTDLARHGYGDQPDLDYLAPKCAASVRAALATTISPDGWYVEADYGDAVSGTASLPLADAVARVELIVDDRSLARVRGGEHVAPAQAQARWRVELELDGRCTRITSLRVTAA